MGDEIGEVKKVEEKEISKQESVDKRKIEEFQCEDGKTEGRIKRLNEEKEIEEQRKSKDSKVNKKNKRLCKFLEKQE